MREKIYRAFTSDIADRTFDGIDSLNDRLGAMAPYSVHEEDGFRSYKEAFLVRFAYESNAIEGSTLTLGETAQVLEGGLFRNEGDCRISDVLAAKGCADGYAYIEKALSEGRELSEDFIKDVHEHTALDVQSRARGMYRLAPAYIRGSHTVTADAMQIRELMPCLLYAYNQSQAHPMAKAVAFHAMFENIHPFSDGNGRTGRLLLNYMLQQAGCPPVALRHDTDFGYRQALEAWSVHGNTEPFMTVVGSCVEAELQERLRIAEATRQAARLLEKDASRLDIQADEFRKSSENLNNCLQQPSKPHNPKHEGENR